MMTMRNDKVEATETAMEMMTFGNWDDDKNEKWWRIMMVSEIVIQMNVMATMKDHDCVMRKDDDKW